MLPRKDRFLDNMELAGKHVLVVGFGRTGQSAARFLVQTGARVTVTDRAAAGEIPGPAAVARELGVNTRFGGHDAGVFVEADLIVLSPGVPAALAPLESARKAGIPIIGEVELAARYIQNPLVAITGTNGKTTTTTLVGRMLEASGLPTFVGGNIGRPLIDCLLSPPAAARVVVAEVSSFQLETIDRFRPDVSVLLNITPDHLDRYTDIEAYADAKCRIFENQQPSDTAVVNGFFGDLRRRTRGIAPERLLYCSPSENDAAAVVTAKRIHIRLERPHPLHAVIDLADFSPAGRHNAENAAAASLAALSAGASLEGVRSALKHFKGLPHRMMRVAKIHAVTFYDDSKATNVDASARALAALSEPIHLILGGRDKGGDFSTLKPLIEQRVKHVVVLGEAAESIAAALDGAAPISRAASMQEAVKLASARAAAGDAVLLSPACASFDMFNDYAHRGEAFCRAVEDLA